MDVHVANTFEQVRDMPVLSALASKKIFIKFITLASVASQPLPCFCLEGHIQTIYTYLFTVMHDDKFTSRQR